MKVLNKSLVTPGQIDQQIETPSWRVEYSQKAFVFRAGNGKTVVVEGDLYYCLNRNGSPARFTPGDDVCRRLKRVYDSVDEDGFAENVEGRYNAAIIDQEKDSISIIGDAFNRLDLFYWLNGESPIVSTEFGDVLAGFNTISDEPAVTCCLLILGYPPLKHTPYRGLRRLAVGERLLLENGKAHLGRAKVKPVVSVEMDEADLDRYAEILENAVLSRCNQSENWVGLSSGWDSTTMLGILRKYFDASKVRAVISVVKLSDGRYFNSFEIERTMKIAKHYDVPVEMTMIDLADDKFLRFWGNTVQAAQSEFVYDYTHLYQAIADTVREKGRADAAVFIGSYSDALHNFGFSQYVSLPYLSQDFRQYSDKIRSYLYSPSFLEKVSDGTFEDDFAYKLFRWHHSQVEFTDVASMSRNERIFEYLLSFVMSNSRLPFARIATGPAFSIYARDSLKGWLYENYFKDAVEQIDGDTMYFWLTWLYHHFHLQGFERRAVDASLRGSGMRPSFPYYDLRLVKFLQTMPENWGRGLEWRPTKYPLKRYGREKLGIPYEILESGFHSYITELEQTRSINMRTEIINNSVLTANIPKNVRGNADLGSFFNQEWFNIAALNDILATGRDEAGSALPLRLLISSFLNRTNA